MSLEAVVAFAPVFTHQAVEKDDGRTLYSRGAFQTLDKEIPLVIDHDLDRQIGIVRSIGTIDDGHGLWHSATCTITDAPSWLKRGTGASVSYLPTSESTRWGYHNVMSAILKEITVTSSTHDPVNPDARVLLLKRAEEVVPGDVVEVIHGGPMLRRKFPATFTIR